MYDEMKKRKAKFTSEETRSFATLTKIIAMDNIDIEKTDTEHDQYLRSAIESYVASLVLESADESNMSLMFRLFGLWISNQSDEWISTLMERCLKKIPSHKFVPLMTQMTTHLGSSNVHLSAAIGKYVRKYMVKLLKMNVSVCS